MTNEILKEAVLKYPEYVTEPFDIFLEKAGFEPLLELADEFGGGAIYVPVRRNMFKKCLIKAAINEFDGSNHRSLAKKYDFSVDGVRGFLKIKI